MRHGEHAAPQASVITEPALAQLLGPALHRPVVTFGPGLPQPLPQVRGVSDRGLTFFVASQLIEQLLGRGGAGAYGRGA